ncbi:GTP pyrophosphokinase family protein [Clostridium sardiniense]|uniref:GTP pyrophosphokinase family protein n=1 Tax=Clostridium sardiniense TaxID=29369 RepID=A0ABS7KWG7_CLOSR|nr:GTP pyrophosphokinase family protein [Clostridium sardiniense]MBY0754922.1 GTP pyrophosphokinase family protein [Clostridium sardiniense]MDQ0461859.1 putative GTP pyrophosphokinase [Clostridium sardiniense]
MYREEKCELKGFAENEEFLIWTDLLIKYEFAIEEISTKINILNNEFKMLHDYNPIEHIKTRVKKPKSIVQKLISKGLEPTAENIMDNLKDIAGVRIICSFTEDIYLIFNILSKQDDINVIEVKDYIKNPKENGYRSLHAIITIPVFLSTGTVDVPVEIQIRTIAMDFWASLEHKLYYKYRNKTLDHISSDLRECADMITVLDNKMIDIRKEIEKLSKD